MCVSSERIFLQILINLERKVFIMKRQESYVRVTASGTITIPAHLRRKHFIKRGDVYQLNADEEELSLIRVRNKCLYCGADETNVELITVFGKMMCADCMNELSKEIKEKKPKKKKKSARSVGRLSEAVVTVSAKSN